jgi:hypothetical protein
VDQALRRVIIIFGAVACFGCGSDDSKTANAVTADASVDNNDDRSKPDAATSGDKSKDAGATQTGTTAKSCQDLKCKDPATCSEQDGKARCSCPDGYDDPNNDGSDCVDKDECAGDGDHGCDKNAKCTNQPGGFECACNAPAYKGDGKTCECAAGYELKDGLCLANDGGKCGDPLDCVNGNCVSGICCATACTNPDGECKTDDGATCNDGHTCSYPLAKNGADCDDGKACTAESSCNDKGECISGSKKTDCDDKNPCTDDSCDDMAGCKNQNNTTSCDDGNACTSSDVCASGSCTGAMRDCSSEADGCNKGSCDPASGNCRKEPLKDGQTCDDANSCTSTDKCSNGACGGDNACGINATGCAAGSPNTCTCKDGFVSQNGLCVPTTDECAANPCSPNATCFDPSNNANDVQCTCKAGYTGDGKTCTAVDACAGNPCGDGRGTCSASDAGKYTCACSAGFTEVAGQCVCNMAGTFALRTELDVSWDASSGIESGKDADVYWSIVRQNYDVNGQLQLELIACGETNIDLCGTGITGLVPVEAYAQYAPAVVWSAPNPSGVSVTFDLANAVPGKAYQTPNIAALGGITLTDPNGTWPSDRRDVAGTSDSNATPVNGARWLDTDNDGVIGITTYAVGPNGVAADGSPSAPLTAYGTHSTVCPRSNPNAARSPYNYPPAAEGLTIQRVKRFASANRVISAYNGTINSCDDVSGTVSGPDSGSVHFDARVGSCIRVNGTAETACSSSLVDFIDETPQSQNKVDSSSFVMKRVSDTITCDQVRSYNYN